MAAYVKTLPTPPVVWKRECYQLACNGYSIGGRYSTIARALAAAQKLAEDPAIKNSTDPTISVWGVERTTVERKIAEVRDE